MIKQTGNTDNIQEFTQIWAMYLTQWNSYNQQQSYKYRDSYNKNYQMLWI